LICVSDRLIADKSGSWILIGIPYHEFSTTDDSSSGSLPFRIISAERSTIVYFCRNSRAFRYTLRAIHRHKQNSKRQQVAQPGRKKRNIHKDDFWDWLARRYEQHAYPHLGARQGQADLLGKAIQQGP
jgi:hypothetical protein